MSRHSERITERPRHLSCFLWGDRDGTVSEDEESSGSDGECIEAPISNKGKLGNLSKAKSTKRKISSKISSKIIPSFGTCVGTVNEGASTSNNVEASSFTRPDLPLPPSKKGKFANKFSTPLPTSPNLVNFPKKGGSGRVKSSSAAKPSAAKPSVEPAYSWLDLNTPLVADQPVFEQPPPGLKIKLGKGCQPVDFFNFLFGGKIIDVILAETNHYASNCAAGSHARGWVDIDADELFAFLGIMIGTMIVKPCRLEDMWSHCWARYVTQYSAIMTKARFFQIKHHLHFNDNCKMPCRTDLGFDKLYKIEPIITLCTENFRAYYQLHQEVAVDESITRFKGRNTMKQYDASKPIKRGFKWWTLADSHTGYVYDMKVYTGKEVDDKSKGQTGKKGLSVSKNTIASSNQAPNLGPPTPKVVDALLGTRAVLSVVSPHLDHKNHIVFLDRFFTSLPLVKRLSDLGIYVCGTIRQDRVGIPDCMRDANTIKNLARGGSFYIVEQNTGVQVVVWQDNKPVDFVNNYYPCEEVNCFVRRKNKDGTVIVVPCPPAVKQYNRYMNGVDRADQKRMAYGIDRRSKRWPMRLFWHCLDTAISNAFILFCDYQFAQGIVMKSSYDLLAFRCDLLKQLIGTYTSRKRVGRPLLDPPPPQPRLGPANHKIVDLRDHGVTKRRRCVVCLKAKKRRESFYGCVQCNFVTLCMKTDFQCFEKYHTQLHF